MKKYLSPIFLILLLTSCKTIENSSDSCSKTTYHDSELNRRNRELLNQQRRDEAAQRQRNEEERRRLQAQQTRTRLEAERLRLETARQRQIIVEREEEFRRRQREYEQARLENERRQRTIMEQAAEQRRRQNALNAQERARQPIINQEVPVNQEERDLQQAMQNSLITAREEERRRAQAPQNAIVQQPQRNQQIVPIPQDNSNYRDEDYRLAGNITMDLSRSYGRQPTRAELITTWKTRIGITQAQAERIYTNMFG